MIISDLISIVDRTIGEINFANVLMYDQLNDLKYMIKKCPEFQRMGIKLIFTYGESINCLLYLIPDCQPIDIIQKMKDYDCSTLLKKYHQIRPINFADLINKISIHDLLTYNREDMIKWILEHGKLLNSDDIDDIERSNISMNLFTWLIENRYMTMLELLPSVLYSENIRKLKWMATHGLILPKEQYTFCYTRTRYLLCKFIWENFENISNDKSLEPDKIFGYL